MILYTQGSNWILKLSAFGLPFLTMRRYAWLRSNPCTELWNIGPVHITKSPRTERVLWQSASWNFMWNWTFFAENVKAQISLHSTTRSTGFKTSLFRFLTILHAFEHGWWKLFLRLHISAENHKYFARYYDHCLHRVLISCCFPIGRKRFVAMSFKLRRR